MKSRVLSSGVCVFAAFALMACGKGENGDPVSPDPTINEAVTIRFDLNTGSVTQAGYEWVDNSGVIHMQGRIIEGQVVSGDLVGKCKTTVANSEHDPQTGITKEHLWVECDLTWSAQNRQGLFTGEMMQEIKAGARSPMALKAEGQNGFTQLHLEVVFEESAGSSDVLVGKGRIIER